MSEEEDDVERGERRAFMNWAETGGKRRRGDYSTRLAPERDSGGVLPGNCYGLEVIEQPL